MKIRTRFAPSPTGFLHIGGARTALFCYLWAHHNNGEFLLRLEDTDIERNVFEGEKNIIDGLDWLKITPNFAPGNEDLKLKHPQFRQIEKKERYLGFGNQLLKDKKAYKCFCQYNSEQEFEDKNNLPCGILKQNDDGTYTRVERKCLKNQDQDLPYSIRILMPENETYSWKDGVRGDVSFASKNISDWVAIKTNGIPTYNFANPIDDIDMEITHVMRGEEHISNTPKQIYIYNLFDWKIPEFIHLTVIISSNGKKLSKRDNTVLQFLEQYKQRGYLADAVLNFLALLGWSPKTEKEIFTKEELIKIFTIDGLSKAPSMFDLEKLKWFNNQYIQKLSKKDLIIFLKPFIDKNLEVDEKLFENICLLYQSGLREGIEIKEYVNDFILEEIEYSLVTIEELKISKFLFDEFYNILTHLDEWDQKLILLKIKDLGEKLNLKGRSLMRPLRLKLTGKEHGPDLSKIIELFGKEKTLDILGRTHI